MKILCSLSYYLPNISGLTIYVQRLAEALHAQGHTVTIVCAQTSVNLPTEERMNGVRVVRVPVSFWISKGAIMTSFSKVAERLVAEHDLVQMNLPNTFVEAIALSKLAQKFHKPLVITYHCDLNLPSGVVNRLIDEGVYRSNCYAGSRADRIVAYTQDYASHSRFLKTFPQKIEVIPPPVLAPEVGQSELEAFNQTHRPSGEKLIGFAARLATEKGVEYLVSAMERVLQRFPNARVLFAGNYKNVMGEDRYRERVMPLIEKLGDSWRFIGVLNVQEMATFFKACDVTVLPSINSTESFGLVQVESMLAGCPVVASDLPGVRVSVKETGMGKIVPPKDAVSLATAIVDILESRSSFVRAREEVEAKFSMVRTVSAYKSLFEKLINVA